MPANTGRLNPGMEYQFKVITYTAVCLSENSDVDNFIIYTNKEEVPGFDDVIVKVWYKSQPKPFVYLGQIKHRADKVNLNNKANSLSKYINDIKDIFAKKESVKFLKELFAGVPDENVEFWFFCSNSLTNTKKHPIIVDEIQYHEVKYQNPKSIYPFIKNAGCYKLTSNDTTKASGDLERFYLFLDQPDIDKINEHILNCDKETFSMETTAQIITYVTEYLKGRIGSRGLRKDVFQIQLLRLCLSLVTISPTEATDIYDDLAWFWNELTLEHDVTIVDQGEVDMKPYLFGAFWKVLQKILNNVEFNWNDCISKSHKLPENFNFDKFVQLTKRNNTYCWLSKPDILDTLLVELWKCDYIPLILSSECNISILKKYQHLKKKFIVLDIDYKISNELSFSFGLNVCVDMSNIRSDSKARELLEGIRISLQGREPVKFANVIGNDKNTLSEIRCSHLLNLSKRVRKIFVNNECLELGSSMVFIISHDSKSDKEVSDDWKSSLAISLKSTFTDQNVIINCETSEVGKYIAEVKSNPNVKNYSMYRLKRHPKGKLEYLDGDLFNVRHFIIDETGTQILIQGRKLTPIVGTILCKEEDEYVARYLRKATVETSFLNFEEEERIVFLTGDVNSLETNIIEKIIDEYSGDVEIRIKKRLTMKKSAFVSVENEHLEEHWSKFSSEKYPIFHIQVDSGALMLVKYKNYRRLGHYIAYERQTFPEKSFFEETSPGVCIISGEAGLGKTTLLHSLFEQYDKSNFVLFGDLIKHLDEIRKGSKSELFKRPLKYILSRCEHSPFSSNCSLPNGFFSSLCEYHHKTNRLLLIIDSFDEALRIHRDEVLELVRIIINSNIRVIIACGSISERFLINNFEAQPIRIEYVDKNSAVRYLKSKKSTDLDIKNIPEEFLQNPLYLEFLSTCSADIFSKCNSNNLFPLYSATIQKQIRRFCQKSRDANNLKYREDEILNVHKLLALASIVGKNVIEDRALNYDDFVQECVDSCKLDLGIVTGFNNGCPIFTRKTFAEFLVALWISENVASTQAQRVFKILLDSNQQNIRLLLDNHVCENLKLHRAVLGGDLQLIENICAENREYLECTDKYNRTPLHLAASYCQDQTIGYHSTLGEPYNNNSMYKILEIIVQHMNKERCNFHVRDLLMKWTWFEYVKRNNNFFEELCRQGLIATMQKYLDVRNININENDVDKALRNNQLHTAALLLKYNPALIKTNFDKIAECFLNICELNPILDLIEMQNASNEKFIHFRQICQNMQSTTTIAEYTNFQISGGFTALHLACMYGNIEVFMKLIEAKADLLNLDKFKNLPLHYAVMRGSSQLLSKLIRYMTDKNSSLLKYLKLKLTLIRDQEANYYVNAENCLGRTPLHIASINGTKDIVHILLRNGANIDFSDKEGKTALHLAVQYGHLSVLERLLEERAIVNYKDNSGNTILHYAAQKGNIEIVNAILAKDVNTNMKGQNGNTALHIAISSEHMNVIELLIKMGTDTNIQNDSDNTALHSAIIIRRADIVKVLLESGANVNLKGHNGRTPFHMAAYSGQPDIFKMILCEFADLNVTDKYGDTAFHCAVQEGNTDIVCMLVQEIIEINVKGRNGNTPLHTAAYLDQTDSFEILLNNGADVNVGNDKNETFLQVVSSKGQLDKLQILLKKYINLNLKGQNIKNTYQDEGNKMEGEKIIQKQTTAANFISSNNRNSTALHVAVSEGILSNLKSLLRNAEDINIKDDNGMTPLCLAAKCGQTKALKVLLLENKADVNIVNNDNNTVLHLAAQKGVTDVVEILLKQGMDVNLKGYDGWSPLCITASYGHIDTLKLLLERGADVNDVNDKKNTALHLATREGKTDIVEILLKQGLHVNSKGSNGWSPLCCAAFNGHIDTLRLLLERGADVNIIDDQNSTALHLAAGRGKTDIVEILLKQGMDINLKGFRGRSPLCSAAFNGQTYTLRLLLECGADVNIIDDENSTALHLAAGKGKTDIVEVLLKQGLHVNSKGSNGSSPLCCAAFYGHIDTLRLLLERGADVNIIDDQNSTAFHLAAREGKTDIVEILLKQGMDINLKGFVGRSPFCYAVFQGHIDTLRLLLERGADVNIIDGENSTALHLAAREGKTDIVEILLKQGMDINLKGFVGRSPLCYAAFHGHIDTLRLLLERGADVNIIDDENNTALHLAAGEGKTDIVEILLKQRMDINLKGFVGRSPFCYAVFQGHIDTLRLLLERGADVNIIDDENNTALHLAAREGKTDNVEILLKQGMDINLKGFVGRSPLCYAAFHGHIDTLRLLLKLGADINIIDVQNNTALHLAAQKGKTDIVEILLKQGVDVNLKDYNGLSPLCVAVRYGHIDTLKLLLEYGAEVTIANDKDNTVLHLAARQGQTDIVEILLKQGLDVNLKDFKGRSPLCLAACYGHIDTLRFLLEKGADFNDMDLHLAAEKGQSDTVEILLLHLNLPSIFNTDWEF